MIKFEFTAVCHEQRIPIQVSLPYRPGKQTQRARRLAVGELLAILETENATVDASGEDSVQVTTADGTWVIAEARAATGGRGTI